MNMNNGSGIAGCAAPSTAQRLALAVGHGTGDIGLTAPRSQERVAPIVVRRQVQVPVWHRVRETGRRDEIPAALALVDAGGADILERLLPAIHK